MGLFLLGILLTIAGWFIDHAEQFPWLLRLISRSYAHGIAALDILAGSEKHALTPTHPGFSVLLGSWPGLEEKVAVRLIGRTVAFMEFGPTVKNDFQLVAYDAQESQVGKHWSEQDARSVLTDRHSKRQFWAGTVVFYVGIVLSLITGVLEFLMP